MMAAAVILRATNVTTLQTPHLKPGTGHGTARLPFRVRCGVLWWVSLTSTGALGVPSWVVGPQLETFSAHGGCTNFHDVQIVPALCCAFFDLARPPARCRTHKRPGMAAV